MDYASAINNLFMKEGTLWELSVIPSAYQSIIMSICHSVELLWSAKGTSLLFFFSLKILFGGDSDNFCCYFLK